MKREAAELIVDHAKGRGDVEIREGYSGRSMHGTTWAIVGAFTDIEHALAEIMQYANRYDRATVAAALRTVRKDSMGLWVSSGTDIVPP